MLKSVFYFLFIAYTLVLCFATLAPADYMSVPIDLWDKFLHFVSFGAWSVGYYMMAHLFRSEESNKAFKFAVIYGASFGALIEILQFLLPLNRSFELADFFADLLGAFIFTFIIKELIRIIKSSLELKKSRN